MNLTKLHLFAVDGTFSRATPGERRSMKFRNAFLAGLLLIFFTQAQAEPNLWAQKAARDQSIAATARAVARSKSNQRLLAGMKRGPSGLNYATAKCSDGWQRYDFENQVGQICDRNGCIGLYARHPESSNGWIFTCNYYLNNGSQCHAEAYDKGYSVNCINPALKEFHYLIITN
jgi:hypothetical protein